MDAERGPDRPPVAGYPTAGAVASGSEGNGGAGGNRDGALILVADDVPANVELLFDQLHTLGYRTISARDGPSALAAAARYQLN